MRVCDIDFDVKELNGEYCLVAKTNMLVDEFKKVLSVTKEHGGFYSRANGGFVFKEMPDFTAVTTKTITEVPKPVVSETAAIVKEDAKKLLNLLDKAKQPDAVKVKEDAAGQTFEVYPPASFETCEQHFKDLMNEDRFSKGDHRRMLEILTERCREDADLRAAVLHKDYLKMLNAGGTAWVRTQKNDGSGNGMMCTPEDIADCVVAEYKKVEAKPVAKATTTEKKKPGRKKGTGKKTTKK